MTQERRKAARELRHLQRRYERAPHGQKNKRLNELQDWILRGLRQAVESRI